MHEIQLMRQVVERLTQLCHEHPTGRLSTIRLEISSHSHLANHTTEELQTTFQLAAEGTPAKTGTLDIQIVLAHGLCQSCGKRQIRGPDMFACGFCSSTNVKWDNPPELTLCDADMQEGVL